MNKKIIFVVICLLCGIAYGQGTGYLYKNGLDGWQNMIRYHATLSDYITYSTPSGLQNHFAITDIHNVMTDAHVADGYIIKDFEILDDYVFFCGINATNSGFIGWFHIVNLFYGGDRVYIDETLSTYGIENLYDIEVYYDRFDNIHIAGVGEHIVSGSTVGYKAFEAVGNPLTNMQYRVADLEGWDVNPTLAVTDDYVVYASVVESSSSYGTGINLEPFPRDDMFPTMSHPRFFFQTVQLFPSVNNTLIYINDADEPHLHTLKVRHKDGNKIAICNYRQDFLENPDFPLSGPLFYYTNNFYVVIREFDLAPLLANNPIQMLNNARIPFSLPLNNLKDFRYDPLTKNYIVLFNHSVSTTLSQDAIMTADYSSGSMPAMVDASYQQAFTNWQTWSLCLNNSSKYTVSGWDNTSYNYFFWQDDIVSASVYIIYR